MEISLFDLKSGKNAKIKKLDGGAEFQRKLATLNIRIGKIIRKITRQPLSGPVIIEIDNTKVSLGVGMSTRIFVEEI